MKKIFILTFLLGATNVFSQTLSPRSGTTPEVLRSVSDFGTSRAVVIGISDYQNNEIPDLRFANRDAEAFAQYLRSDAGGNLDDNQLMLLTNERATTAQFAAGLDWLMDESKEGDKAIIYFSGHGDVERKTRTQLGFLLTWDSPPKMYVAGAFPIFYLQEVVSTLSLENKAKVIIITDACRSGKLAGRGVNGSQLTNANLSKQFANEIKIMSCQPNEYSIEGEQWGGGRGAFSYHLIDGLYGMADKNTDLQVTLSEIDRYLEDRVTPEVAPISQVPMTVGFKNERMSFVDADLLAALQSKKIKQVNTLAKVESRGIEEEVLANVDSTTRQHYFAWKEAIANKQFFEPAGTCADDLYGLLAKEPSLARLHNHIKRNYAAALQDDAQQMLNDYLYASHKEIDQPLAIRVERYARFIKQLQVTIDLLGSNHYMYNALMGRKLFIEAMHLQKSATLSASPENLEKKFQLLKRSLEFEPDAAYTLSWLGDLASDGETAEERQRGIDYYHKAAEVAPNWGQPYLNLGSYYLEDGRPKKAQEIYNKALEMDPNSLLVLTRWGAYREKLKLWEEAEWAYKKAIQLDSTYANGYVYLAELYLTTGELEKALEWQEKVKELALDDPWVLIILSQFYYLSKQYEKAEEHFQKAVELSPSIIGVYNEIGFFYRIHSETDKAEKYLQNAIDLNPKKTLPHGSLAWVYFDKKEFNKVHRLFDEILISDPKDYFINYFKALFYIYSNELKKANEQFEKLIMLDSNFIHFQKAVNESEKGNYEIASKAFEKTIALFIDYDNIQYLYCRLKIKQGKYEEALDLLDSILSLGRTYNFTQTDPDLKPIQHLNRYQQLMRKHFPEKFDE